VERSDVTGFTDVDGTRDPDYFIRFLDARKSFQGEQEIKQLEIELLDPTVGAHILDVGCGTGDDVRGIAALVGLGGKVIGLDASASMIEEARRRAAGSGLPVEFVVGDACHLQFPDSMFAGVRTDRVLVHLADPATAIAEMVRVVKPGGRVVLSEVDAGTFYCDSPFRELTRKILNSIDDGAGSGWVGRALPRLLQQAGLHNVVCRAHVIGFNLAAMQHLVGGRLADPTRAAEFAPGEIDAWWQDLVAADAAGCFSFGNTIFTAVGRRE
jgi:ubiquinone/menaquinone biosynthesis C-methylase UbiE